MNRLVLAAVLGGIVLFAWGAFIHMALPVGEMGLSALPGEAAVVAALADAPHGAYIIPGSPGEDKEGPWAFIVYHPRVSYNLEPRQLVRELLGDIGGALIAGFVMASAAATRGRRVAIAAALGAIAWFSISFPSWNWFHYPAGIVLAEAIDEVVGWSLAGAAMSFVLPASLPRRG